MPGPVPGIHVLSSAGSRTWMAGTSPAMTEKHTVVGVRHCERSEAIHSATSRDMDCFVASLLAMTELERFPAKWKPVRVKKTRQNKNLEPRSDSIGTDKALDTEAECQNEKGCAIISRSSLSLNYSGRSNPLAQNIKPSLISTQRPFLTCWTWVMVLARWSVLENLVGGELKMSRNFSPDSSESIIFWPVRSLPAF